MQKGLTSVVSLNNNQAEQNDMPQPLAKSKSSTNSPFLVSDATTKAEIIQALHTVLEHRSLNAARTGGDRFRTMFPDSDIAKNYAQSSAKMGYVLYFGPYFQDRLHNLVKNSRHFVVFFDE